MARSNAEQAASNPTPLTLDGPLRPRASTLPSMSPNSARVFVPPPSTPRLYPILSPLSYERTRPCSLANCFSHIPACFVQSDPRDFGRYLCKNCYNCRLDLAIASGQDLGSPLQVQPSSICHNAQCPLAE